MIYADDDLDLERELEELENNKEQASAEWENMNKRGHQIRKQLQKRQLDPLVAKTIQIAQDLGHALGANEALANKISNLSKRINIRDDVIAKTQDRDEWKKRAEVAELKISRRRKK